MFCANCGKELKDGDKFCNACGRMVTGGESSNNSAPYVDAVPVDAPGGKKLWSKKLITAISIAAAGVVVFCLIVGAVTAGIGRLTQNHKYEYRRFGAQEALSMPLCPQTATAIPLQVPTINGRREMGNMSFTPSLPFPNSKA